VSSNDPGSPLNSPRPRFTPSAIASRVRGEFVYGKHVVRGARMEPPPREARIRRFVYGVALPFAVLAAVLRDPELRVRYLRITGAQLAVFVPFALLLIFGGDDIAKAMREAGASLTARLAAISAAVFGLLKIAEWIVIALSRRYHAHLAVDAALLTRAPYEPCTSPPGIALDFRWMWKRVKRKTRSMLLFASGLPIIYAVELASGHHHIVEVILVSLWASYWSGVFVLAGSHLTWQEASAKAPWFVRSFETVGTIPFIGWPFRAYARMWRRATTSVHAPCAAFEEGPFESAGLALTRTLVSFPGVYIFVRPVLGVAATHAFLARFPREMPETQVTHQAD
jgi:hypothetical protein